MLRRIFLILFLLAFIPKVSHAYDASSLVASSKGTLPLILTVPHDGGEFLGLMPPRTKGAVVRDAGTRELAENVASLLEKRLGKRPYLVIAKFSRKFLDANRSEQDAMESQEALPAYRAYHDQVRAFASEVKLQFPAGALLVDVHGQSDDPNTTFRGTRGGLTAKALLARSGPTALQGEKSILGVLASKGYPVNPVVGAESLREDPRFAGGYTVFHYGSQHADGIDAIQLEFGKNHRANPRLAEDLTEALIVFMTEYELLPK
jgi:N-formylglutamate amidohydrolase